MIFFLIDLLLDISSGGSPLSSRYLLLSSQSQHLYCLPPSLQLLDFGCLPHLSLLLKFKLFVIQALNSTLIFCRNLLS